MKVKPSAPRACAHCPWRLENQGKPHPDGFYRASNLRRLWAGLKDGEAMSCHPTDDRMNEYASMNVPETAQVRECTGANVLVERELYRFQEACKEAEARGEQAGGFRAYRALRGPRMTRSGLAEYAWRLIAGGKMAAELSRPNLNDPDVGYPPLGEWEPIR